MRAQVDVVHLVEARLELDQHRDLLAALRGLGERAHDRRVAGRAVQRHLDRQHVRIDRGRREEVLHRAANESNGWCTSMSRSRIASKIERVVSRSSGGIDRLERRIAELGNLERREPHEIAELEQRTGLDEVGFGERRHLRRLILAQLARGAASRRSFGVPVSTSTRTTSAKRRWKTCSSIDGEQIVGLHRSARARGRSSA